MPIDFGSDFGLFDKVELGEPSVSSKERELKTSNPYCYIKYHEEEFYNSLKDAIKERFDSEMFNYEEKRKSIINSYSYRIPRSNMMQKAMESEVEAITPTVGDLIQRYTHINDNYEDSEPPTGLYYVPYVEQQQNDVISSSAKVTSSYLAVPASSTVVSETNYIDADIDIDQIPRLISNQFNKLEELERSIKTAMNHAKNSEYSARKARNQSAGLFHRKAAIESLQRATSDLADSQLASVNAQKVSFEHQQKLCEISTYLLKLGIMNITSNRTVIKEIEMRLKNASEEEISDMARAELKHVIIQLKDHQDTLFRMERLEKRQKETEAEIEALKSKKFKFPKFFKKK